MKLKVFNKRATKRERAWVAEACGTTEAYLYQLGGGHRKASPALAIRVEAATRMVARGTGGRLSAVPRESLVKEPQIFDPQAPVALELAL
ncbi:MAG: hypothetical protein OXH15_10075 [Gammaproteobacteria bacterium]|nr:hypothetical protein [Gammaproteobacteria bacterium]